MDYWFLSPFMIPIVAIVSGCVVAIVKTISRNEVRALEIFDQRDLKCVAVTEFAHDDRNFMKTRELRRTPATFDVLGGLLQAAQVAPGRDLGRHRRQ